MVPRQERLRRQGNHRLPRRRARRRRRPAGATPARSTGNGEPGARLQTAYEAALSRTAPAPTAPGQRIGPRPWIISGQPIDAYTAAELIRLARWIRSDDALRTEDELLQEMMLELGFQRRGKNVVARLTAAIAWSAPGTHGRNDLP